MDETSEKMNIICCRLLFDSFLQGNELNTPHSPASPCRLQGRGAAPYGIPGLWSHGAGGAQGSGGEEAAGSRGGVRVAVGCSPQAVLLRPVREEMKAIQIIFISGSFLCVWWGDGGQSFGGLLVALAKLLLVRRFCCNCTAGTLQSWSSA